MVILGSGRGRRWRLVTGGLVAGLLVALTGCGEAEPEGQGQASILMAGLQELSLGEEDRPFLLFVPSGYDPGTPTPLIIGLHGRPGDSWQIESSSRLSELAEQETALVAYPDQFHSEADLRELVKFLQGVLNVATDRMYAAGFSAGGTAAWRLAATAPDLFAATVSVGGPAAPRDARAAPVEPVAVLSLVGLADSAWLTPMENGLAHWQDLLDCETDEPTPVEADPRVSVTTAGCGDGSELVTYRFEDLGHVWPNDLAYDFDPNDVIWDFLAAHSGAENR